MKRCPACHSLLYRRKVSAVELDGCPSCGGIWMDHGELQALGKTPAALLEAGEQFRPVQKAVDARRTGLCPRCGKPLGEFEYHTLRGIRLERCRSCEGVWLDRGEAETIGERLGDSPGAVAKGGSAAPALKVSPALAARFSPVPEAQPVLETVPEPGDPTSTAGLPVVRGQVLASRGGSPGFLGSLERGLHFIRGAYTLALERPALLKPLIIGGLFQLLLGGGVLAWFLVKVAAGPVAMAEEGGHSMETWVQANAWLVLVLGLMLAFTFRLANLGILGMTVSMVDAYLKGREPNLGVAWKDVLKNAGALVAMAAIDTVVQMLSGRGRHGRRSLIGEAINAVWTTLSFLLLPVIMIEDVGLGVALRRVKEMHGRGLMQIAVGEVGLRAIGGITAMLVALLAVGGFFLASPITPARLVVLGAVLLLLVAALGVLHAFARGAYYTCLYLWAVEVERVGDPGQAMVPGPLAFALER